MSVCSITLSAIWLDLDAIHSAENNAAREAVKASTPPMLESVVIAASDVKIESLQAHISRHDL